MRHLYSPRGFHNYQTSESEKSTHDTLHKKRDTPREVALDEPTAIVNPHGRGVPDNVARELDTCQLSSVMRRGNLRLVDGHNGGQSTDSETGYDSAKHHDAHVGGKGLESTSDEKYTGAVQDSASPSNDITDPADYQRRNQSTNFEDSDHGTHMGLGRMVEVVDKVRAAARLKLACLGLTPPSQQDEKDSDLRDDARHDTLVIAEKEDTE